MDYSELKRFLFSPKNEAPPLFSSQRELALAIATRKGSHYYGKENSLIAFINQILVKNRPCPNVLAKEIITLVEETIKQKSKLALALPYTLIEAQNEMLMIFTQESSEYDEVEGLLHRQLSAKEVVIVNPYTLEVRGHPRAGDFQDAMLNTILDGEGQYKFIFDNKKKHAFSHWRATHEGLKKTLHRRNPNKKFRDKEIETKLKDLEKNKRIGVFHVAPSECIIPLVAFDPDQMDKCDIFVWDWWNRNGKLIDNIAKLSEWVTNKWIEDFYSYIRYGERPESKFEQVHYEDYLKSEIL